MTHHQQLREALTPDLTAWMEQSFPAPVPLDSSEIPTVPALYLYLAKHDPARKLPSLKLAEDRWDVWYVGETENLQNRHKQHLQKVGTCRKYGLLEFLTHSRGVTDVELSLPEVLDRFALRRRDFPQDRHSDKNSKDSIGWSAVTHVSWLEAPWRVQRVRTEETLVGILHPPLNWVR